MNPEHSSYSRVIVNKMEQFLFSKAVEELRIWTSATQQYDKPANLFPENVSATSNVNPSKIWNGIMFQSFGDAANLEPSTPSNPNSTDNSDLATVPDPSEARITQWTTAIVSGADPDIAPEAPVEPVAAPPRRRVVLDSDSDDDVPHVLVPRTSSREIESREDDTVPKASVLQDFMEADGLLISIADVPQPTAIQQDGEPARADGPGDETLILDMAQSTDTSTPNLLLESSTPDTSTPITFGAVPEIRSTEAAPQGSVGESSTPVVVSSIPQDETIPPHSRPSFNPNAYGSSPTVMRGSSRGGSNRRYQTSFSSTRARASSRPHHQFLSRPEQTSPRGGQTQRNASGRASARVGRLPFGRESRGTSRQSSSRDLIDISAPPTSQAPRVPPGFESHVPLIRSEDPPCFQSHERDPTDESRQRRPSIESKGRGLDSRSLSSGEAPLRFSADGADYTATFIPRMNQAMMRENSLRAALDAVAARGQAGAQATSNKKAPEDLPQLHSTMRQRTPNPGKKSAKQETKSERRGRLAKAMEDAYGPKPVVTPARPASSSNSDAKDMSEWKKKQLKKVTPMAEAHPNLVGEHLRKQQCDRLLSLLQPVFETGRSFSGRLRFEIQFGQVLISPGPQMSDLQFHDMASWSALFDSTPGPPRASSTFTNILTTNGADIDRVLDIKCALKKDNDNKFWSSRPGPRSVTYEFSCQSRSNEDFVIVVDQFGMHELRKGPVTVGAINIHVPAHVWDASATLSGDLKWTDAPESVTKSAAAFVNSLYVVPQKEKLTIVFRQPNDHEIKIRNLIVKRVSHHAQTQPDHENIKLKVTEAKSLLFKVHPQDKKLWQGYEAANAEYDRLARDGRIHYELSLIHEGINEAFAENEMLEVGELTDGARTGKSLLDHTTIQAMLSTTVQMVSKIDFVGMHNFGTQLRLHAEKEERLRNIQASLGPAGKTVLQVSVMGTAPSMSASRFNGNPGITLNPIPAGVRMGTDAQLMVDPDGSKYYLGMGGARIPIVDEEPASSSLTVVPEDSASQVGRTGDRVAQAHSGPAWMSTTNREAGFW